LAVNVTGALVPGVKVIVTGTAMLTAVATATVEIPLPTS
jgi:hypothetical protein